MEWWWPVVVVYMIVPTCILSDADNCNVTKQYYTAEEERIVAVVSFCCSEDFVNYTLPSLTDGLIVSPIVSIKCYDELGMIVEEKAVNTGVISISENATECELEVKLGAGINFPPDGFTITTRCDIRPALLTTLATQSPQATTTQSPLAPSTPQVLPFPSITSNQTPITQSSPALTMSSTSSAQPAPSPTSSLPPTSIPDVGEVASYLDVGEVAALITFLVVFLMCFTALLLASSYLIFKRCKYYQEGKQKDSSFLNYCEKLDHKEPDVDFIRKMVVSVTIDSINSDIIEIGTSLLGENGTHRPSTEDIQNCDDGTYSDSNSINDIHRCGSYDGYLNVCEDRTFTGNFTTGLNQSYSEIDVVNTRTSSTEGTSTLPNRTEIHSVTSLHEDPCPDSGIDV